MRFISTLCLLLLELFCFAQTNYKIAGLGSIYSGKTKMNDTVLLPKIYNPVEIKNEFTGEIRCLNVTSCDSNVLKSEKFFTRCGRSLKEKAEPLLVVDGIISKLELLNKINPHDISDIKILKTAEEVAIYGYDGANGVIVVTTFRPLQKKIIIKDFLDGSPIPWATVSFISSDKMDTTMLMANDSGLVITDKLKISGAKEIYVSAVGYKQSIQSIRVVNSSKPIEILLEREVKVCDEVVVTGFGISRVIRCSCGGYVVRIGIGHNDSTIKTGDKISIEKIYPNPVKKGNSFVIEVNIQAEDIIEMVLVSLDGKSLFTQKQKIFKGPNRLTINTDPRWSAGIYFVQLYAKGKLLASEKVVIQ